MYTTKLLKDAPLWNKMFKKKALFSFSYEVTARCNNNCRHCYINLPASDEDAKASELTISEIDRISSEAVDLGAFWCSLTGGEPLLRKDFEDIYLLLKRKGLLININTNATLINEQHVRLFKKYPPRSLEVSVYGVTQETYEAVTRCHGTFAGFQRGLDLLMSHGVSVTLKAMALRSNLHEHQAIANFCRKHTKGPYRYDPILSLRLDGDPKRNAEIKSERLTIEEIVKLEAADPDRYRELTNNCDQLIFAEKKHLDCRHLFHCKVGLVSFDLTCDGKFRLCGSLTAPETIFDLRKGSLKEAFTEFVPLVRDIRSDKTSPQVKCTNCELINLCAWCPATAYLETGALDQQVDYFCQIAHARAKLLNHDKKRDKQ
jgi:radical SAM protein with 4Fe4S-binding SPASM domain